MANNDQKSRDATAHDHPLDERDVTPPHGDELLREGSFGRTDRYTTKDDPDAEEPVTQPKSLITDPDELSADARRRRMEEIDDAAADEARMATRKRDRSAD